MASADKAQQTPKLSTPGPLEGQTLFDEKEQFSNLKPNCIPELEISIDLVSCKPAFISNSNSCSLSLADQIMYHLYLKST